MGDGSCDAEGGYAEQMLFGCPQCELAVGWAGQGSCGRGACWAGGLVRRAVRGCVGRELRCDVRCGLWRASAGCRGGGLRASCAMRLRNLLLDYKMRPRIVLRQAEQQVNAGWRSKPIWGIKKAIVQAASPESAGKRRWAPRPLARLEPLSTRAASARRPARGTSISFIAYEHLCCAMPTSNIA